MNQDQLAAEAGQLASQLFSGRFETAQKDDIRAQLTQGAQVILSFETELGASQFVFHHYEEGRLHFFHPSESEDPEPGTILGASPSAPQRRQELDGYQSCTETDLEGFLYQKKHSYSVIA